MSLFYEYRGKIDVLSVEPAWVRTVLTGSVPDNEIMCVPEEVTEMSLQDLGQKPHSIGALKHQRIMLGLKPEKVSIFNDIFDLIKQREE